MNEISIASFSGGRSSALMLHRMLDQGNAPDHIIFCNTGMESAETLAFIAAVNDQWLDGRLTCLEFAVIDGERSYRQVAVSELKADGSPFRDYVMDSNTLPSPIARTCTDELKVRTIFRFLYSHIDYTETAVVGNVGLRADEPRRIARLRNTNDAFERRIAEGKRPLKWSQLRYAPLADAGIDRTDVIAFFQKQPLAGLAFNPGDPDLQLSNCMGCFYGNIEEKIKVVNQWRDAAEWWAQLEHDVHFQKRQQYKGKARPDSRAKWIKEHLGREIKPGYESDAYAIHHTYLWTNIIEYAQLTREQKTRHAIPLFDLSNASAGGCETGECGLDI